MNLNGLKVFIPMSLIFIRLNLGFIAIGIALFSVFHEQNTLLICMIITGVLSDIFDGIIARKMNIATVGLRRLDSQVDLVFWLCIGISIYILFPKEVQGRWIEIASIFILETCCYLVSYIKFGRETCTHAYSAKLWGITLCISAIEIFSIGKFDILFTIMWIIGIVSHLDVILITLILPQWTNDVPSLFHAYKIRQGKSIEKNIYFHG